MDERLRCEQSGEVSEWMSLALDGVLKESERQQMAAHLEACPICRAEWHAMQAVSTVLQESPMVGPPLGFAIRMERRLAERARRRRLWGRVAILSGSLPLTGAAAVAALLLVVVGSAAWIWLGSQPVVQNSTIAASQVATGLGLLGKGASLFLKDLLLRYGLPALAISSMGMALLSGIWAWIQSRRPRRSGRNGYA